MDRQTKLLVALAAVTGLYLLSRTRVGEDITAMIADVIGGHEGYRLDVYPDEGGKWTVGRGHLILATDRVIRNGKPVPLYPFGPKDANGNPTGERRITAAEEMEFFEKDTTSARNVVANKVNVPVSLNQRAALVSLAFNIGNQAFTASTLLRKLNAGDYQGAADQFLVWKKINGKDSAGLLARRVRERELFLS